MTVLFESKNIGFFPEIRPPSKGDGFSRQPKADGILEIAILMLWIVWKRKAKNSTSLSIQQSVRKPAAQSRTKVSPEDKGFLDPKTGKEGILILVPKAGA